MPSHVFTRLGLWEDSIASNLAARDAARRLSDTGEELHAMDYLVYAYLQIGHDADAAQVIQQLKAMRELDTGDFKIGTPRPRCRSDTWWSGISGPTLPSSFLRR